MDFTIVIGAEFLSWQLLHIYQAEKLEAHIFKKHIRNFCSKSVVTIVSLPHIADQIPRILDIAMRTALSLSGVSIIVLPGDVALQEAVSARPITQVKQSEVVVCPSSQEIAGACRSS